MDARLRVEASLGAMRRVAGFVAGFASRHNITPEDQARVFVVIEELLTNLVKYGYVDRAKCGSVEIALGLAGTRLTIEFIDDGCSFNPFAALPADLDRPIEDREVGGFGLHILRGMAEEAIYSRVNERNVIQLTRRVSLIERA